MKKILISLILILTVASTVCLASDSVTVSLIQAEVQTDDICIDVHISQDSKACGGNFYISYDNGVLKPVKYEVNNEFTGGMVAVNLNYDDDTLKLSWAGIQEVSSEGSICKVFFSPVSDKSFSTSLDITKCKLIGLDDKEIPVEVKGAEITKTTKTGTSSSGSGSTSGKVSSNTSGNSSSSGSTLQAGDVKEDEKTSPVFSDVKDTDWFADSVRYVIENNLMNGIDKERFAPDAPVTRAMVVTVLHRQNGAPEVVEAVSFKDTEKNAYYSDAVAWAKESGIVNGVSETLFAPNENVTREQFAAIIHRFANYIGYDTNVSDSIDLLFYDDFQSVSEYALLPMKYAVSKRFIKGKTASTLNPADNVTRAEMSAILQRFIEAEK